MTDTRNNIAETIRDLALALGEHTEIAVPELSPFERAHLVTLPDQRTVHDLTAMHRAAAEYLRPARRKGTAQMHDLQSLILWANRNKGATSALFASPDVKAPTLTCIADYHAAGPANPDPAPDDTARHCHHRAVYNFPLSEEWKDWSRINDQGAPMDVFGEFIEAHAQDILDPTPAVIVGREEGTNQPWENRLIQTARQINGRYGQLVQMLSLSNHFKVFETSDLKLSNNRNTGETEVQFLNEHKAADGKPLNLPNLIIIAIPVFQGGALYRMAVRFRYRKKGPSVEFILSIYNPEKAFEAAFREAVDIAAAATELPMFLGKPES